MSRGLGDVYKRQPREGEPIEIETLERRIEFDLGCHVVDGIHLDVRTKRQPTDQLPPDPAPRTGHEYSSHAHSE